MQSIIHLTEIIFMLDFPCKKKNMNKAWSKYQIQTVAMEIAVLCVINKNAFIGYGHVTGKRDG